MLKVFSSLKNLNFRELMAVYEEQNRASGAQRYGNMSINLQILFTEQDFYDFLTDFFKKFYGIYAIWMTDNQYVSAIRFEPYKDGMLLEGLETKPTARGKGYATALMNESIKMLQKRGVAVLYSHVKKNNARSLSVHRTCGFEVIMDCAVYIDGTVTQNSFTLRKVLKEGLC